MKNTSIKLTSARCAKLIAGLESLPTNEKDATWNQTYDELKQVQAFWKSIDVKAFHRSQNNERAKSNRGS